MITDDTIDTTTAKCWCIFSEPEFREAIMKASKQSKKMDEGLMDILQQFNAYAMPIMTAASVIAFVGPYLFNALKKIRYSRNDSIAKIDFEADGSDYSADFNIKQMKWMLTGSTSVNDSDVISFFRTQFFDTFVKSCASYIAPIVENEKIIMANVDKIEDSSSKKFLKSFFKYKQRIITNLLRKTYIT